MSLMEKLGNIDRRWVYLLGWIAVLVPLSYPLGLPVSMGRDSRGWFSYIEDIPDGSVIMVTLDYGTIGMPELYPMTVATFHHLWNRNFKVVVVASWNQGPMVMDVVLDELKPAEKYGKVYGEDWIELGWFAQSEIGMAALGKDIWATIPVDHLEDKPTSSYSIMQDIKTAEDVDLLISFETGTPGLPEWARQWITPYDTPVMVGCIGVMVPEVAPYLQTGQCRALLPGLTASAEYEQLLRRPGLATAGVDAISVSHLLVIILVVVGNVAYLMYRGRGGS